MEAVSLTNRLSIADELLHGLFLYHGECCETMRSLPDACVALIIADPPYFKVKKEWWDQQWETAEGFLSWLDLVFVEFHWILAPNGSLYLFTSPKMAARIECQVANRFEVLSQITWTKPNEPGFDGWKQKCSKESLRQWYPASERIIFAEHLGADRYALGESGWGEKCEELRGFAFEPLRAYLDGERRRAGITQKQVITTCGMTGHDPHFFKEVQWAFPSKAHYLAMRELFNREGANPPPPYNQFHNAPRDRFEIATGESYLSASHSELLEQHEYLKVDYEYLRADHGYLQAKYEDLRRPFNVSTEVSYTDVWDFPTVRPYPGKHPCEKPLAMMEHIVAASSREGGLVLDPFCGSGVTGQAAMSIGRKWVGIDVEERWCRQAQKRIEAVHRLELPGLE